MPMQSPETGMMRAMPAQDTDKIEPRTGGSHARDLRFAGAMSAGLVTAILACGALLAPMSRDFTGTPALRTEAPRDGVVQLAPPPPLSAPGGRSAAGGSGAAAGGGAAAALGSAGGLTFARGGTAGP